MGDKSVDFPPNRVSSIAYLIADPTRTVMLMALVDGRALPAGELAYAAGVTPQTASAHLAKLLAGGLLQVETEGRHRYYRLAGAQVALALEHLATIRPLETARRKPLSRESLCLRFARRCYDHLAGQLGVAIAHGLQQKGYLLPAAEKQFVVTPTGVEWFGCMGLEVQALRPAGRGLARQCLDWTERRHHLAGPLGVQLLNVLCASGWLRHAPSTRAIQVTPEGWAGLKEQLGINERSVMSSDARD
ncbi:MAG: ArsR/SmtB family transcription factor [Acidiferrobacteraceae bacterium]